MLGGFELQILMSQLPKYWFYRHTAAYLASHYEFRST